MSRPIHYEICCAPRYGWVRVKNPRRLPDGGLAYEMKDGTKGKAIFGAWQCFTTSPDQIEEGQLYENDVVPEEKPEAERLNFI